MGRKPTPRARRPRGTGSIFWSERRGCWVGRVPIGRGANGKTVYAERCDVSQARLVEKLKSVRPPGPETTVGQWADRWLDGLGVRPTTKENYAGTVANYIKPALGHLRVSDVTAHAVEQAARKWARPRGDLGPNTVRLALAHLSACLGSAVRAGLIPANPVRSAHRPPGKKKKIDPFTPGELARIVAEAMGRRTSRAVAVLASVGCRVGEVQGLDVSDWNPAARTIAITKTVAQKKAHGIGPPKSPHSVRTVRVPLPAVPAIRVAIGRRKSGPIFATAGGLHPERSGIDRPFQAILKRLGLRRRNLHQLRHSVATMLISASVPIGDVAKYLGDTPDTIVRTYLHPSGVDPVNTLDVLLGGGKVDGPSDDGPRAQGL